ncbi:UDP-Glycosyltransferase/glycogen phosphorylase [Halteromyces radiatus]|uniref:UDP-Glycosyltransferase/glycogen phosphorylase n=1 Tax=Halteromyces radiatus TaxID=101107 RepID=UPI00221FE97D|nr:UDP-Glycosyltransferase/glycogen phosphorylase [Halteromyces radiatus]KAI8086740.1 UDP-Glycosyltransferase/glycogen phosphorylase [Halteromyces radiatus]
MDTVNHSVLQFVSAAALALEAQDGDGTRLGSSSDLGRSIEAIYSTQTWSDVDSSSQHQEHDFQLDLTSTDKDNTNQPLYIQELLAEATGTSNDQLSHRSFSDKQEEEDDEDDDDEEEEDDEESELHNLSSSNDNIMKRSIDQTVQLIFHLPRTEKLQAEWPCYIVRSAIVPGFLYLTEQHVCFYASLPSNQQGYHKTGYMMIKTSRKMGNYYRRCYFDLKNDVLAWYESATDTYSPLGKIDLKYTLSVRPSKKRQHGFRIVTMNKTWHLKADTDSAMMEWLAIFQKAIFKAKNSGSNLKMTFPFSSILDIEYTDAFEFQQFLKIRVVGIEDSFVMDEYYFAYFPDIKSTYQRILDAWNSSQLESRSNNEDKLSTEINDTSYHPDSSSIASGSPSLSISDLYDANSQPIVIQSLSEKADTSSYTDQVQQQQKPASVPAKLPRTSSVGSVVANALAVPGALKELIYPSSSDSTSSTKQSTTVDSMERQQQQQRVLERHGTPNDTRSSDEGDSSSSGEEEKAMVDWLDEKRRSGMKLVYGLLAGSGNTGSTATVYHMQENNDHKESNQENLSKETTETELSSYSVHGEVIDDRILTNFRKYFVLPESEKLIAVFRCSLLKTLPCYGKLYISTNHISFNSKGFATKAKMIIPFEDVLRIQKLQSKGYIFHSLSILTQKKKEIFLEFSSLSRRNSCFAQLFLQHKRTHDSRLASKETEEDLKDWEDRLLGTDYRDEDMPHIIPPLEQGRPILSKMTSNELQYQKPDRPLHFTCITIGTRGDVQPYIALCKSLMKDGHTCRIATHEEFKDWIEEHHIEFRCIGGDPGELMRICVENNFFSVNFVVEGLRLFKVWIDELLELTWKACQGTDVLIESPSAMIGVHIAEKLRVPYFRSFPMPMTRTRSFPHPFATPNSPKGRLYNDMTYVLFDHAVWRAISSRTNAFREKILGLPATTYENLEVWKIPYLYSFSTSIVPSPLDWMDWVHCTGYWFLDNPQTGWQPDNKLLTFLNEPDKRPIVYIGFGSIIVSDPQEIIRIIVEAVLLSNVRAIVSEGWSSRLSQGNTVQEEPSLLEKYPKVILNIQSVPHDWLFPKVRAVVHHGGAGTTAAGLRAGRPTVVKPFFADQFFWGERVEEMGVGLCIKQLSVESLSAALRVVSTDESMLKTAKFVGEKIRSETGVETAIQCIYRDMELARNRTISSAEKTRAKNPVATEQEKEEEHDIATTTIMMDEQDQDWTLVESSRTDSSSDYP